MHAQSRESISTPPFQYIIIAIPMPPKSDIPQAAQPRHGSSFDPWNSSSTGHQRAENRLGGSTGWRNSRSTKLHSQFKSGAGGGERKADAVGAGSGNWDKKAQVVITPELRARAKNSVVDMLANPGTMKQNMASASPKFIPVHRGEIEDEDTVQESLMAHCRTEGEAREVKMDGSKKIFDGVVVYVNGSTHPIISDHKLKHILAENGARIAIHLGRRQVTHVILGRHAGGGGGAGGGLAGGKLQKEIRKVGGAAVKFVDVEWILESVQAGKRLPEARFGNLKVAPKGQHSLYGIASRTVKSAYPAQYAASATSSDRMSKVAGCQKDYPPPSGQQMK